MHGVHSMRLMQQPSLPSTADVVSRARRILGLNQASFGKMVGKSQGVISRYENGEVEPPGHITMHCVHILRSGDRAEAPPGSLDELVAALEATLEMVRAFRDGRLDLTTRDRDSDNSHQPRQA